MRERVLGLWHPADEIGAEVEPPIVVAAVILTAQSDNAIRVIAPAQSA